MFVLYCVLRGYGGVVLYDVFFVVMSCFGFCFRDVLFGFLGVGLCVCVGLLSLCSAFCGCVCMCFVVLCDVFV